MNTPRTTVAALRQAMQAACTPLTDASVNAWRKGRLWIEVTSSGDYRLTAEWNRQWARACAPGSGLETPAELDLSSCSISVDDAQRCIAYLGYHAFRDDSPIMVQITGQGMMIRPLDGEGPKYASPFADNQATPTDCAPLGPYLLPCTETTSAAAVSAHTLAMILGGRSYVQPSGGPLRLYPVPGQAHLTAWTIGDWAHGRTHLGPHLRQGAASALQSLTRWEDTAPTASA